MMQSSPLTVKRSRGMTLLELIVAMAVASLIALLGASALSSAVSTHGRGNQQTQLREDIRTVERMVRHEWSSRGQWVASNGGWLEFDTLHPIAMTAADSPAVARVRYSCEASDTDDKEGFTLRHEISTIPESASQRPAAQPRRIETAVIAQQLRACSFSLLRDETDPQGRRVSRWTKSWTPVSEPPRLMRMALSGPESLPELVFSVRAAPYP